MDQCADTFLWWQTGIIYQIYPRSFQDSNNDGIGDLQGIIKKLPYLQWLGVTAIWISPFYPSPMYDFGYDISDYQAIHPMFGTMDDFDRLLEETQKLGMRLIIDLVPNHTSSLHPWFIESASAKTNAKRDWYIWRDAKPDGGVPNNWLAAFGGSGWEWHAPSGQYYFHSFLKEQPDLNWRNPEVQAAFWEVMRFWLNKGVDGFRMDVLWHLIKDADLRDNPANPGYTKYMSDYDALLPVYSTDQPEVHDIVRKMRKLLDEYDHRLMIGEIYLPINKLVSYYGTADARGAHLPYNFQLIFKNWDAESIFYAVNEYEGALSANDWPNWVLGNHDQPRVASRMGEGQTRVAAMLLMTLRGTPTIYYGDEIGMTDVPIPFAEIQDPQGYNMPQKNLSRDPCRTPMQWNTEAFAGFSGVKPWLRVSRDYLSKNITTQQQDPDSLLLLYRRLIALRQQHAALMCGKYMPVFANNQIVVYYRKADSSKTWFLIVLNFSHRPYCYTLPDYAVGAVVVVATYRAMEQTNAGTEICLYGNDGCILKIEDHDGSNI